jgi:hypothetical protein
MASRGRYTRSTP